MPSTRATRREPSRRRNCVAMPKLARATTAKNCPKARRAAARSWKARSPKPKPPAAKHDRAAYEQRLNTLLSEPDSEPEARLERALVKKLASAWLWPNVAERCKL